MANDLNRSIKIYIDGTAGQQSVEKLEQTIAKLEAKLTSLNTSESNYAAKSQALKKEIDSKNLALNNYKSKLSETERVLNNLSGASYDKLLAVSAQVRRELRAATPETKRYNAALEQNRRVTEALTRAQAAMRVQVGSQGTMWSRSADWVNKYIGVVATAIAAITGVSIKLNQLREKRNKREEATADVEALTGLSKKDIAWLDIEAKKMATTVDESGIRIRKSATEILDAFKLVGSAKPELLENKEALAEVTKQTLILASASDMDLKSAVDAVTLSLNQYGDGADQASRYTNVMAAGSKFGAAAVESVTSAITKSGVAASSAGIPIEQLVGSIETLAEKGIKDEIAGTGLKKFFLTLQTGADQTNPRVVGLEKALDNLQKKQLSAAQIKKMFGEEGYNVASVLINEADKVKYYTQAVTDTTVAVEQAVIKSDTAAAKLDQSKNTMEEIAIDMMNKLSPSLTSVINKTVNWTQKLIALIGWMVDHKRTIGVLVTAIAGYILITKAQIIEEKLKLFWTNKVIATTKRLYELMVRHPYAVVAVAVLTLIAYLKDLNTELTSSEKIEQSLNNIRKSAIDSIANEKQEVEQLMAIARDETKTKAEREAAIRKLNELSPDYLGNLTLEKINTEEATKSVKRYIDSLILLQEIKLAQEQIDDLNRKRRELIDNGVDHSFLDSTAAGFAKMLNGFKTSLSLPTDQWADKILNEYTNAAVNDIREIDTEIVALNTHIEESRQKMIDLETEKPIKKPTPLGLGGDDDDTAKKRLKKKLDAEKTLYEKHEADLKKQYLEGTKTEKEYNTELERLQLEHLARSMEIVGATTKEGLEYQNQINDIKIKQRIAQVEKETANEKILFENQQAELKTLYASGQDENLNTEKAYNEAMEQLTIMHLQRMLSIAGLDSEQQRAIAQQLLDFKVKCMQDEEKERIKLTEKDQKKKEELKERDKQRLQRQAEQYRQYGEQIGETVGMILSNQENAMESFADTMIDILFDILSQMIDIEIAKATGVAVGAVARASAESFAQPDSVLTFGASGAARAAVLSGLIMGALATAKSALKGLIKRGSSSSDSGESSSEVSPSKSATVRVTQWATGRYDVIGEDDNKKYNDVPFIGPAPTGIVRRTALVSETGSELIVNTEDLMRLQQHVNYPLVLQAINDARSGRVPQRAEGNYSGLDSFNPEFPASNDSEVSALIAQIKSLIISLKNLRAYVLLRDIKDAEDIDQKSNKPFTRKTK